jgi:cytochrome b
MSAPNLALRFLLEIAALIALGLWGAHAGSSAATSTLLAVTAPLLAAVLWGLFVSPKARVVLPWPLRLAIELAIFIAAVAGLAFSQRPQLAAGLAGAIVLHQLWRAAETKRVAR